MRHATGITRTRAAPGRRRPGLRHAAGLLILLAFLVRALIPAGFMPVFDSDQHVVTVAMCSGHGAQTLPLDDDAPARDEQSGDECPFASLTAPAVLRQAGLDPYPIRWMDPTPFLSVRDDQPAIASWRPGSPPTGPPTHV